MFYYLHRDEAYRSGRQSSSCGCQTASLAPPHANLYRLDDQYARNPNQPSLHSTLLGQQRHRENAPLGPRMICRNRGRGTATAKTPNCAYPHIRLTSWSRVLIEKLAVHPPATTKADLQRREVVHRTCKNRTMHIDESKNNSKEYSRS